MSRRNLREKKLHELKAALRRFYPAHHQVIMYEAALLLTHDPRIIPVALDQLQYAHLSAASTLYIPPLGPPPA